MSLSTDIRGTLDDLHNLGTAKRDASGATDLVEVRDGLATAIRGFKPAWQRVRVLAAAALLSPEQAREIDEHGAKIRKMVEKFQVQLEGTPRQPRKGGHFARLKTALDIGAKESGQLATSAWRTQKERVATLKDRVRQAASSEDEVAESLNRILDQLSEGSWEHPPSSPDRVQEHQGLVDQATKLADRLKTIEIPGRVARLLEKAARTGGANFYIMTPDVYGWLREHSAFGDELSIRRDD